MNILPVSVSRKINKVKTNLKEYHRKDNVFPDPKVERNVKFLQATLFALAVAGAVGAKVYFNKKVDFPKLSYEKFIKKGGKFKDGKALMNGEPFSGKILKYTKEGFANCIGYQNGRLQSSATFNALLPSPAYCKKRYIYDAKGKLKSVHIRNEQEYKSIFFSKGKKIVQKVNGELTRTMEPIENGLFRRTDYKNGEIVNQIFGKKLCRK